MTRPCIESNMRQKSPTAGSAGAPGPHARQTRGMSERTELARNALAVVEGVSRGDADAEALITSAFDNPNLAAHSYAYLCGFILEVLGRTSFDGSTASAASGVRFLLDRLE